VSLSALDASVTDPEAAHRHAHAIRLDLDGGPSWPTILNCDADEEFWVGERS